MANPFRSLGKPSPAKIRKSWNEAEVVAIAQELLTEHAAARAKAIAEANVVCGGCAGTGKANSILMPGETVPCVPCNGTGQPNEQTASMPALGPDDRERMWKIEQLLKGPHRLAVVQVIKAAMPDLYPSDSQVDLKPAHAEA